MDFCPISAKNNHCLHPYSSHYHSTKKKEKNKQSKQVSMHITGLISKWQKEMEVNVSTKRSLKWTRTKLTTRNDWNRNNIFPSCREFHEKAGLQNLPNLAIYVSHESEKTFGTEEVCPFFFLSFFYSYQIFLEKGLEILKISDNLQTHNVKMLK